MVCVNKKRVFYTANDGSIAKADVNCGHCLSCLMRYSYDWSIRCRLEASLHNDNTCVTLTYKDVDNPSLEKRDYQLFLKKLRKKYDCRYFGCGEYGEKNGRKHFHIILFGVDFKDKVYFKKSKTGGPVYTSKELSSLWPHGWATIGEFSQEAAVYCAKYLAKIKPLADGLRPPFCFMSLKPSIGIEAVTDDDLNKGYIYINGKQIFLPRSFYKSYARKGILFPDAAISRAVHALDIDSDEYDEFSFFSERNFKNILDKLHFL